MAPVESKGSKAIADRMDALEPGTPRYEVLEVARRFKTSWVDLGEKLWKVRNERLFEAWGFAKFDDYCRDEIRIKPRTAAKLTASYGFLQKEEPAVLKRDGVDDPVPDVQVVDMLRKMREKEQLPEREYHKIKEMAFNDVEPATLRRELRQKKPAEEAPPLKKIVKQLLAQANKLADALAATQGIPHVIVRRALSLVDDLRALAD
jgi:hypothetical protein